MTARRDRFLSRTTPQSLSHNRHSITWFSYLFIRQVWPLCWRRRKEKIPHPNCFCGWMIYVLKYSWLFFLYLHFDFNEFSDSPPAQCPSPVSAPAFLPSPKLTPTAVPYLSLTPICRLCWVCASARSWRTLLWSSSSPPLHLPQNRRGKHLLIDTILAEVQLLPRILSFIEAISMG